MRSAILALAASCAMFLSPGCARTTTTTTVAAAPAGAPAVPPPEFRPAPGSDAQPIPDEHVEPAPMASEPAAAEPKSEPKSEPNAARWIEVFPHVRLDAARRFVEIDGQVPIDPHDPRTPHIFLEVVVCPWDTREHEALVATRARPSHVHAALLMLGPTPGVPASWRWDPETGRLSTTEPTGPIVQVTFLHTDAKGKTVEADPAEWIIDVRQRRTLRDREGPGGHWVFAGSSLAPRPDGPGEYYKADIEGTLVGLATFGVETIAWSGVFSHEASINAPEWIADPAKVPPFGSAITVRLAPADGPAPSRPDSIPRP